MYCAAIIVAVGAITWGSVEHNITLLVFSLSRTSSKDTFDLLHSHKPKTFVFTEHLFPEEAKYATYTAMSPLKHENSTEKEQHVYFNKETENYGKLELDLPSDPVLQSITFSRIGRSRK